MATKKTAKQKLDVLAEYDAMIARRELEYREIGDGIEQLKLFHKKERLRVARSLANTKAAVRRHRELKIKEDKERRAKLANTISLHTNKLASIKEKIVKAKHELEVTRETLATEYAILVNRHSVLVDRIKKTVKVLQKAIS